MDELHWTRRKMLAGLGAATATGLAGCSGLVRSLQPELVVFNRTDGEIRATTTVESDGKTLLSKTATIQPDEAAEYSDAFPDSGTVTVAVAVEEGPEGRTEADVSKVETLQARVWSDSVEFKAP